MKKLLIALVAMVVVGSMISRTQTQIEPPKPAIPIYSADGKPVPNAHIVIGRINTLPGAPDGVIRFDNYPVITLSGAAAFTSADSFKCFGSEPVGSAPALYNGGLFKNLDGSHVVYQLPRGGPSWQQGYLCIGS